MAFDAAKGMEDSAAFSAREVRRAAAEERDEYFFAECKVIPASLLKIEGWGTFVGTKDQRKCDS